MWSPTVEILRFRQGGSLRRVGRDARFAHTTSGANSSETFTPERCRRAGQPVKLNRLQRSQDDPVIVGSLL